jgi:hypothetical protein
MLNVCVCVCVVARPPTISTVSTPTTSRAQRELDPLDYILFSGDDIRLISAAVVAGLCTLVIGLAVLVILSGPSLAASV